MLPIVKFCKAPFGLLFVAVVASSCGRSRPPNVVLVVIDTLRADHCSAFGYPVSTTPNLERMAADGVRFERAWSQAAWTLPSMVSLMTGRYVLANYNTIPVESTTLAERFRDGGFATAAIVANPLLFEGTGFERGFDHYEVAPWSKRQKTLRGDRLVDATAALLDRLDEPFFLWLHLYDPHDPYQPPPRLTPSAIPVPSAREYRSRQDGGRPVDDESAAALNDIVRYYDGEVSFADEALGGILRLLEDRQIDQETLVAVTSDHGEGLFSHAEEPNDQPENEYLLYRSHGDQMYEEALHVPMVLRGPRFRGGERRDDLVENVDLWATMLTAAQLPLDAGHVGFDLAGSAKRSASFAFGTRAHAVRTKRGLKLIHPAIADLGSERTVPILELGSHPTRRPSLFDLNVDPQERAGEEVPREESFDKLKQLLVEWQEANRGSLGDAVRVPPDMQQRLRQLGYIR